MVGAEQHLHRQPGDRPRRQPGPARDSRGRQRRCHLSRRQQFTLDLGGTEITGNHAREGGGAVFFVSNDRTGTMTVRHSTLERNPSAGFENYPGIFFLGAHPPKVRHSVVR